MAGIAKNAKGDHMQSLELVIYEVFAAAAAECNFRLLQ